MKQFIRKLKKPLLVIWGILATLLAIYCVSRMIQDNHQIWFGLILIVMVILPIVAGIAVHVQNKDYIHALDRKNHQIQKMTLQTITTIANAIDAKDEYTKGHSKRVAEYSYKIAREMGIEEDQAEEIRSVALLHDIGKIGVPDAVLNKPGKLTDSEYSLLKQHTTVGGDILKDINMIPEIDVGAKYHHERYDGLGYPYGLAGEEIPFIGRIIAIADAFDAMTSNRVYRRHLTDEEVLTELKKGLGVQFDPDICEKVIHMVEEGRLSVIQATTQEEIDQNEMLLRKVMDHYGQLVRKEMQLDELTSVYSFSYGEKLIKEALRDTRGSLILYDLDHFREVNDEYGFVQGDYYLKLVADAIIEMDSEAIIARYGGDQFVAFYKGVTDEKEISKRLDHLNASLEKKSKEQDQFKYLSVSAGVVVSDKYTDTLADMYYKADKALYYSKQQGCGQYYFYHDAEPAEMQNTSKVDMNQLIQLVHNENEHNGGLSLTYPEFYKIYDFLKNVADLNHTQIQILMFTMIPNNGGKLTMEEHSTCMAMLEHSVSVCLRDVDITTRYSSTQRIVLLMNTDPEEAKEIAEKMMKEFYKIYDKPEISVHYDIADFV